MRRPRFPWPLLLPAAVLVLTGAGCALDQKIGLRLPFWPEQGAPADESATTSRSIAFTKGLAFVVRPSTLGVSGSVDQVLGLDSQAMNVRVEAADPERSAALEWTSASASGTLAMGAFAGAHAMLLPAFWQPGATTAEGNGGLWLSRAAYGELNAKGETEWRLGLADNALSTLSSAFKTFNAVSAGLFGSATAAPELSPFTVKKTGEVDAFPLMLDGRVELVRAVTASSWFADFVILDNPDDPLILKVSVNPAASPALRALEPAKVRWDELGYEITSVMRP